MNRWLLAFLALSWGLNAVDTVIWNGTVNSNGNPSPLIRLELDKTYVVKVSGNVNLGKWQQQGKPLSEDACYDFSEDNVIPPSKNTIFSNSINISVCDGSYHSNHVYESKPFVAKQNGVHFWVKDEDYDNNSGAFEVQVIAKE